MHNGILSWNDANYPNDAIHQVYFPKLVPLNPEAVISNQWRQYLKLADFTIPGYSLLNAITSVCR